MSKMMILLILLATACSMPAKKAIPEAPKDPNNLAQARESLCTHLVSEMFKRRKNQQSPSKDCMANLKFTMGKLLYDPRVPGLSTGMNGTFTWKYIDDFTTKGEATFLKKLVTREDASIEGEKWYVSKSKKDVKYFSSRPFLDKIIENTDFHRGNGEYKKYDMEKLDAKEEFLALETELKDENDCLFDNIDKTKEAIDIMKDLDVDVDMEDILDLQKKGKIRRIILRKYKQGPLESCLLYKFKVYTRDSHVLTMFFDFRN